MSASYDPFRPDGPGEAPFARLFPHLPPLPVANDDLNALASCLADSAPNDPDGDSDDVPAGMTYLGQFIDHDISFDPSPLPPRPWPVTASQMAHASARSAWLNRDSLYGRGPAIHPHLYEWDDRARLRLGETLPDGNGAQGRPLDVPRSRPGGAALTADPRNDENLLVSQMHVVFARFHNAVRDRKYGTLPAEEAFRKTRRVVKWHFQWIVIEHYLRSVVKDSSHDRVVRDGIRFFDPSRGIFMPVEFAMGAYRFGHSMVRETYALNANHPNVGLVELFEHTGRRMRGPLPDEWVVDWDRFFKEEGNNDWNPSRRINPRLSPSLLDTFTGHGAINLALRDLQRCVAHGLPSGQDLARAMGLPVLDEAKIEKAGPDGKMAAARGLAGSTPLWYYVLKEAELDPTVGQAERGRRLGDVGGALVADVLFGLVAGDPSSYLTQAPGWTPRSDDLGGRNPDDFDMVDLIRYARL